MKHTSNLNTMVNQNPLNNIDEVKYLSLLCNERSDLIIRTEYGIGHYNFFQFTQLKGRLVLEFKLIDDNKYRDTNSIYQHIGEKCFLTAQQYITVYSYLAEA